MDNFPGVSGNIPCSVLSLSCAAYKDGIFKVFPVPSIYPTGFKKGPLALTSLALQPIA